ncbi:MAG: phosphoribosylanthranilate isomerase [Meiothermus sp.]|nr:phosphoribosylanthranilate isomerase [Meiothermus sp.]
MDGTPVKAKICGITRLEDALLAEQLGAWALGFILVRGTKRYVEPAQVNPISRGVAPLVTRVGVFVDAPPDEVARQLEQARLQVAQLHGNEPPEWAEQVRRHFPVIKVFKLTGPVDQSQAEAILEYPCDALMVDGVSPGSGQTYPLEWLGPLAQHPRLIIAGGLTPDNVDAALKFHPYAVDLSSGVEAMPRVKDPEKLRRFLQKVRAA